MDVGAVFAVLVVHDVLHHHFEAGLLLQFVAAVVVGYGVNHLFGQAVAAVAAVVVDGERGEHQRHRAGCGHGAGDGQVGEVQAQGVEIFLGEFEAVAGGHVGGGDDGEGAFAVAVEVAEGGVFKQGGFKLFLQQIAAPELGRGEARQVGEGENLFGNLALEVLF